jgi:xylan 1,4-beta-xylosidase
VNLEGALTWAFEFENQPPFAGFRALASDGIDLPVLNVFRMFSKMSGEGILIEGGTGYDAEKILHGGVRGNPDVDALAALDKNKLTVLIWHYDDDDLSGADAAIDLSLTDLPLKNGRATLTEFRIDAEHSNSYTAWEKMGSPLQLTAKQRAKLEKAGQLAQMNKSKIRLENGATEIHFDLPRQGVSLFVLDLK